MAGKPHLIVVPAGALTSLPFHLLVTQTPAVAVPQVKTVRDLAAYRGAAWLMRKHAVTVLPSIASLKILRDVAGRAAAPRPYLGFGNPDFTHGKTPESPRRISSWPATERSAVRAWTSIA